MATYSCNDDAATDSERCQLADTRVALPSRPVDVDETMARTVAALN